MIDEHFIALHAQRIAMQHPDLTEEQRAKILEVVMETHHDFVPPTRVTNPNKSVIITQLMQALQLIIIIFILILLASRGAHAQGKTTTFIGLQNGASVLRGTGPGVVVFKCDNSSVVCNWTPSTNIFQITSVGGSGSFGSLTSGTNSTATMIVGTGASIGVSGSGTIAATSVSGFTAGAGTLTGPATSGTALISGGALGTPSSGTLTNATGLPPAGLAASTVASQSDAATVTWAIGSVLNAQATLTFTVHSGSRTLNITNPVIGGNYILKLIQDGTGGEGITLGTGCTWLVAGGGTGAVTLTNAANALDVLTFVYDGTNCLTSIIKNLD